jgi:predicted ArsR family transcriptional regulator
MSKPTARKHMTNLIEKGYLDERSNPNPKQAKQYRANIKRIQNDLAAMGCSSADWTIVEES